MNAINWRRVVARLFFIHVGLGVLVALCLMATQLIRIEVYCLDVYPQGNGISPFSAWVWMFKHHDCGGYWAWRSIFLGIALLFGFLFGLAVLASVASTLWQWTGWDEERAK